MGDTRKDRIQLLVRRIFLVITDIILINGSVFLSLIMRFEINIASVPEIYTKVHCKCYSIYNRDAYNILVFQDVSQSVAVCKYRRTL